MPSWPVNVVEAEAVVATGLEVVAGSLAVGATEPVKSVTSTKSPALNQVGAGSEPDLRGLHPGGLITPGTFQVRCIIDWFGRISHGD